MDINCFKCNQEYHIPDYQLEGRHLFITCDNCGHEIEIISEKIEDGWESYKGLPGAKLTLKNILDGIFYSFNLKNILLSFIILLTFSSFLYLIKQIVFHNLSFFLERPFLSGLLSFIILVLLTFIYDIHLYLLSLNTFNVIKTGFNIKFSIVKNEIKNDLKSLFIFSIGIFLIFSFLLIPVFVISDKFVMLYEGIFHLLLIILAIVMILVFYSKKIIFAFISSNSRSFKHTFKSLIRFLHVECINIPLYIFFTNSISTIIAIALFLLFFGVLIFFVIILSLSVISNIFSPDIIMNLPNLYSNISNFQGVGTDLILMSTFVIFLFIFAYIINLSQTLSTVSMHIMGSNPGESISKNAILISIMAIIITIIISVSSMFDAISLLVK